MQLFRLNRKSPTPVQMRWSSSIFGNFKGQYCNRSCIDDRIAYVRSPASDFQLRKGRFLTGNTVLCTLCYGTLLSKATIKTSITDVTRGHRAKQYKVH